jgi:hypothetical protein
MDEDLEMEAAGVEPDLGALAARYPDLVNMAPGDVLRELTARQFANIEQQRAAREKAAASKAELFKEGQAEIEKRRYGAPTTREQLFALGAALTSPRYYGGLAGTMSRVAPVLGAMSQLQSRAQSQRDEAMRQHRMQYGIDTEAAEIGALEAEGAALEPLISTYGTLSKPQTPQRPRTQLGTADIPINLDTGRQITPPPDNLLDAFMAYIADPKNTPTEKMRARREFIRKFGAPPEQFLGD